LLGELRLEEVMRRIARRGVVVIKDDCLERNARPVIFENHSRAIRPYRCETHGPVGRYRILSAVYFLFGHCRDSRISLTADVALGKRPHLKVVFTMEMQLPCASQWSLSKVSSM
jgi:hypothetical protein